jgi:hypothetical protein
MTVQNDPCRPTRASGSSQQPSSFTKAELEVLIPHVIEAVRHRRYERLASAPAGWSDAKQHVYSRSRFVDRAGNNVVMVDTFGIVNDTLYTRLADSKLGDLWFRIGPSPLKS